MENKITIEFENEIKIEELFEGFKRINFSLFNEAGYALFLAEDDVDNYNYLDSNTILYKELISGFKKRWKKGLSVGTGFSVDNEQFAILLIHPNTLIFSLEGNEHCLDFRVKDFSYYLMKILAVFPFLSNKVSSINCTSDFTG